ncbi:unnamed protein product [Heterobilharzia americana]|nr:unnamed protein product [Heterobilharzia americana]
MIVTFLCFGLNPCCCYDADRAGGDWFPLHDSEALMLLGGGNHDMQWKTVVLVVFVWVTISEMIIESVVVSLEIPLLFHLLSQIPGTSILYLFMSLAIRVALLDLNIVRHSMFVCLGKFLFHRVDRRHIG